MLFSWQFIFQCWTRKSHELQAQVLHKINVVILKTFFNSHDTRTVLSKLDLDCLGSVLPFNLTPKIFLIRIIIFKLIIFKQLRRPTLQSWTRDPLRRRRLRTSSHVVVKRETLARERKHTDSQHTPSTCPTLYFSVGVSRYNIRTWYA